MLSAESSPKDASGLLFLRLHRLPHILCGVHKLIQLAELLSGHLAFGEQECMQNIRAEHTFSNAVESNFLPTNLELGSDGSWSKYVFHCDRNPMIYTGFVTSLCRRNSVFGASEQRNGRTWERAHLLSHSHHPATAYPVAGHGERAAAFDTICVESRSGARREISSCTYGSGGYSMALASVSLSGDFEIDCAILIIDERILAVSGDCMRREPGLWRELDELDQGSCVDGGRRLKSHRLSHEGPSTAVNRNSCHKVPHPPASSATPTQSPPMS